MTIPLLHLYPQQDAHSEARIVLNRQAAQVLYDTLGKLLARIHGSLTPEHSQLEVFASDGEGYTLTVEVDDSPWGMVGAPDKGWNAHEPYYVEEGK